MFRHFVWHRADICALGTTVRPSCASNRVLFRKIDDEGHTFMSVATKDETKWMFEHEIFLGCLNPREPQQPLSRLRVRASGLSNVKPVSSCFV